MAEGGQLDSRSGSDSDLHNNSLTLSDTVSETENIVLADSESNSTKSMEQLDVETQGSAAAAGGSTEGRSNSNPMDKLLRQQIEERMFELRRLQLGDRPVTGQGNKEAVESFFSRQLGQTEEVEEPPRPEQIIVEVRGLVERRPVSSALQSVGFRRSLENALRSGFSNLRRPATPPRSSTSSTGNRSQAPQPQSRSAPTPRPRNLPTPSVRNSSIPPPPPLSPHLVQEPEPAPEVERPSLREETPRVSESREETPRVSESPENVGRSPVTLSWLEQHAQDIAEQSGDEGLMVWNTLGQEYRDGIISEISELVHQQLVTNTLQSNFRTSLEQNLQVRHQQTGSDGERVEGFIRTLPTRPATERNNFSDLGIETRMPSDDAVSVISATAAVSVPYAQSNAAMSRELQSLKSQLQEMKAMMSMSFNMQLEIQRSIRQEVAAAIAQGFAGATVPAPTPPVDDTNCLICLDSHANAVLYQCGHLCVCYTCGLRLRQENAHCPVCRAPIKDVIRTYKSNSAQKD